MTGSTRTCFYAICISKSKHFVSLWYAFIENIYDSNLIVHGLKNYWLKAHGTHKCISICKYSKWNLKKYLIWFHNVYVDTYVPVDVKIVLKWFNLLLAICQSWNIFEMHQTDTVILISTSFFRCKELIERFHPQLSDTVATECDGCCSETTFKLSFAYQHSLNFMLVNERFVLDNTLN